MNAKQAKRKSAVLTKEELNQFKKYRASFLTDVECAESVGISSQLFGRVIIVGRGAPETIEKIKKAIGIGDVKKGVIEPQS